MHARFPAAWVVGIYAASLVVSSVGILTYQLPEQLLIFLALPILWAAINYPRRVYIVMAVLLGIAASAAIWVLSDHLTSSLVTLIALALTFAALAEIGHQLVQTQRQTAARLRESETRYRTLIENQGEGSSLVDAHENFLFANPAAEQIFGVARGTLVGRNLREFTTPAQFALLQEQTKRRRAGEKGSYELEIIRPDGETRALILTATPHRDAHGQFIGSFGVFRDITERKRTQEALARRDAILHAVTLAAERFLRTSSWREHIDQVMTQLGQATRVSRVYIFENQWEADGTLIWQHRYEWDAPYATPQIQPLEVRLVRPRADGFARWVKILEQGKWLQANVQDLPPEEQTALVTRNVRALVWVPIFAQTTWWGVLGLDECLYERAWSPSEIDALVTAADTLGAAISREWIDAELYARAHHLELLNRITDAAIAAPDLTQMLQTIADRLGELLRADGCFITLWDAARQTAIHRAAYGALREKYLTESAEPGLTMTEAVLSAERALVAEDVFTSPYVNPQEAIQYPTRSLLGLPLIAHGQKLGAALIGFNHTHHFTRDEIERGEQAARHIALAIAKAQALDAERQHTAELETLHEAGLALTSSLDLGIVLDNILHSVFRLSPTTKDAHIYFYRHARLEFAASLWDDGRKNIEIAEPRADGLTRTVARRGEIAVIQNIRTHPLFAHTPTDWDGAIIGLPLKIGARVVGVMNVAYQTPRVFSHNELRVLELLANQAAIAIDNARLFDETKQRAERMSVLNEIGQALTATLKVNQLYRLIYQQTRRVLIADCFFVALYDEPHGTIHFPLLYNNGIELPNEIHPLGEGPVSHVIRTRAPYIIHCPDDPLFASGTHFGDTQKCAASALFVPLMLGSRVLGVISTQSYREDSYSLDDVQVLQTIAAQAAIALENARLYNELQQLAITDELTGLLNRRGLFQLGQREVERARRYQRPLAALLLDLDNFKQINDTHGHLAGDRVLRALADCCRKNTRILDLVGRYGGEEFVLLLPETDLESAHALAERLRRDIAQTTVLYERTPISFTISVGVAPMSADVFQLATLIEHADQAQYLAKQAGRNRVQVYR